MFSEKAIFFDRDGVIIHEDGEYTFTPEKFKVLPLVGEFMAEMKKRGYKLFVITNQGGVGKGMYTKETVVELHKTLDNYLQQYDVSVERYLICPHHPSTSACICRKPDSLLLERAIYLYKLDVKACYLIGDRERDVEAAKKARINPLFLTSNSSLFSIIEQIN
jgi:D-glycero-D-manno-heptose 1,7-bisphosphate phosphatase